MGSPLIFIRELPSGDALRALLGGYAGDDLDAMECYLLLLRAVNDMLVPVEAILAERSLSRGRLSVLLRLMRAHPHRLSASVLAHDCGVRQATMTGLLDCLVRGRLVERYANPHDGRVTDVAISERGIRRMKEVLPGYFSAIEGLSRRMNKSQRRLLIRLLRGFVGASPPDAAPAGGAPLKTPPRRRSVNRRAKRGAQRPSTRRSPPSGRSTA